MEQQITRQRLEQSRDSDLQAAEKLRRMGRSDWWSSHIWAAVRDLEIAVCFYPGIPQALEYLQSRNVVHFLNDLASHQEKDRDERVSQNLPAGNDVIRFCLFACTCWLMDADQVAQRWIELGLHPAARIMLGRFDFGFMDAHAALAQKSPFALPEAKKWLGWGKDLLRYAAIAAAITRNENPNPYINETKKFFDRRNRTYGLTENYDYLDGCKFCPASFDIRLGGILSFARRNYGILI